MKGKGVRVAIRVSDTIDFKTKAITGDKEGHYIELKGSIQQEHVTTVNINASNTEGPKYINRHELLTNLRNIKGEIDSTTIITRDLTILFPSIEHPADN